MVALHRAAHWLFEGELYFLARLINHIAVRPAHAAQMRGNPDAVRQQLAASVCANPGYRQLLQRGAELVYDFSEYQSERPVTRERFVAADCGL